MVVLLVGLKVLVEVIDSLGEKRDLNLGGTRIALVRCEFCDDFFLFHLRLSSYGIYPEPLSRTWRIVPLGGRYYYFSIFLSECKSNLPEKFVFSFDYFVDFSDIRFQILLGSESLDSVFGVEHSFGNGVRARGEIVRRLLHDVYVIYAGFSGLGPAHVLVIPRLIFLSVHIIRNISRPPQNFSRRGDHIRNDGIFEIGALLFEPGSRFETKAVHGDVFRARFHRFPNAERKFFEALVRQSRDKVGVDFKTEFRRHVESAIEVGGRMPAPDSFECLVRKTLRIDADSRAPVIFQKRQFFLGEYVGPSRLHRIFARRIAHLFHGLQNSFEITRLQNQRSSAADIYAAELSDERFAGSDFPFEAIEIRGQKLPRFIDGRRDKGTVGTLGGTKGNRNEKIGVSVLFFVYSLLRLQYFFHE